MSGMPIHYLARHGETAWTLTGQHTGRTDLPLTATGERDAVNLGSRLEGLKHHEVWTSPLKRASRTCELAGFALLAQTEPDLLEWNYGDYEGLRSAEIHTVRPTWNVFRDGCPGGESPAEVMARADRVVDRLRAAEGTVILFSSGHFLRVLAACWLGLGADAGRLLALSTTSLSAIGYEHDLNDPVIQFWNDTHHVSR